jgi:hypothetical protein
MLSVEELNEFIGAANRAHQQLCVWFSTQNEFAKHFARWNEFDVELRLFPIEEFTRKHGCKYKNFWPVITASVQHGWILGTARLFDPAYHPRDKNKENPRISFDYVLSKLEDPSLIALLKLQLEQHQEVLISLRAQRNNALAHNDAAFKDTKIEAGVESLYDWLEKAIARIKVSVPSLQECRVINVKYNEKLSQCGVDEVFETLLIGEKHEPK